MSTLSVTRFLRVGAAATAAVGALAVATAPAEAASPRVRVAEAARAQLPAHAVVGDRLPATTRIPLTVTLAPRDPVALKAFATAVSTPGTAQYGHYLGVRGFAARFGARPSAVADVRRALRRSGFRIRSVSRNQLSIRVSATTAQVERALQTSIRQVRLADGRRAYVNATAATLPAAVGAHVQGVVGLDSAVLDTSQIAHPASLRARRAAPQVFTGGGPQPCSSATAQNANGGYTGDQLATAYSLPSFYQAGNQGQGQTIALYEEGQAYPQSDVATFLACYGLATPVNLVGVDGGPGAYQQGADDGEVTLDIDVVAELAPKATIDVYSAPATATANIDTLTAIVNGPAQVVSISYGACEAQKAADVAPESTLLQQAAAEGKSVFSSSGDAGDASCSQHSSDLGLSVLDPAAQPFNTAVGGTTLESLGPPTSESVWNEGGNPAANSNHHGGEQSAASGGGLSTRWAMPSYQQSARGSLGVINSASIQNGITCGSTYCREVPDVSADAAQSTGYITYQSSVDNNGNTVGWGIVGGTSGASPLWAAVTALFNASATCRGLSLGFVNPSLYAIAGSSYLADFNDPQQNSPDARQFQQNNPGDNIFNGNDVFGQGIPYPTTPNYDMTTGIGTPIGSALGGALCSARAPVYSVAVANPGTVSGTVGTALALQLHGTDSGGAGLSYAASGLPAGLAINAATGVISGTPTTAGSSTVTVSATDGYTNTGATQFAVAIGAPAPPRHKVTGRPTFGKLTVSGLATGRPKLSFSVRGGDSKLKTIAVKLPKGLSFASARAKLAKGITVAVGHKKQRLTAKVKRGVLTITLRRAARKVTVTLTRPAISVSGKEARKIRGKKVKRLKLTVSATNTKHKTGRRSFTVSKLR